MTAIRARLASAWPDLVVVACGLLVAAPFLLSRGYVLIGDMTFVPRQPWKPEWLGLDGSVPRAVPADAIVSLLSHVVAGDLLQKAVLLGALVLAGLGMRRLVSSLLAPAARIAPLGGALLYLWNPWVLERLAIGHWGLLLGYASLPWIARAAIALRTDPRTGTWSALVLPLALAAFGSPTGALAGGLVALVLVAGPGNAQRLASVAALTVVLDLPWLLPGLLGSNATTDPGGVDAFAARADTPLGVVGSLLTFGGIWKSSVVPGERGSALLVLLALGITLAGLAMVIRRPRMTTLGLVGLVLAALPVTGAGSDLAGWLVANVPGAGILRDSQKWLMLFALPVCVGVGLALDRANRSLRSLGAPARSVTGAVALLPLVLLPSLAWGIAGRLDPVTYPAEWAQVASVLADQPAADRRTAVLPWSAYQRYPWNGGRAALDPAIRYVPGAVITNDDLPVSSRRTVEGESPVAAQIGSAIATGADLGPVLVRLGVRYVLVERTAAGQVPVIGTRATVLHQGPQLTLLDLGPAGERPAASYAWVILLGDALALVIVLISVGTVIVHRIARKTVIIG
ncbi:MAG: hypothetical protein JWQ74_790 [Marmoricola sp.]|nr:hypothetical protein [Marmoricola sp.]